MASFTEEFFGSNEQQTTDPRKGSFTESFFSVGQAEQVKEPVIEEPERIPQLRAVTP